MDGFKQRIIGALVLISLAVIFVPMLLDEPHEERTTRSIEIPPEPDFPEVRIEPAEQPVADDPIEPVPEPEAPPMQTAPPGDGQAATSPMNAEDRVQPSQAISETQTAPTPSPETLPATPEPAQQLQQSQQQQPEPMPEGPVEEPTLETGGYLVQLGSFGSGSNAERLSGSVEEAGFTAHTTTFKSDGNTYTRVFAGPFADEEAADAAKLKLDSEFGLNTLVVVNDR